MAAFKDSAGAIWEVAVTVGAIKRVRSLCKMDLDNPHNGDPSLAQVLTNDHVQLIDVIYAICKPQADAVGLTDEDFGGRLGGRAVGDAVKAFFEAWLDFFRNSGHPDKAMVIEQALTLMSEVIRRGTEALTRIDVASLLNQSLPPALSLPESSESIPTPGPIAT